MAHRQGWRFIHYTKHPVYCLFPVILLIGVVHHEFIVTASFLSFSLGRTLEGTLRIIYPLFVCTLVKASAL